jgi:hypothetical protein
MGFKTVYSELEKFTAFKGGFRILNPSPTAQNNNPFNTLVNRLDDFYHNYHKNIGVEQDVSIEKKRETGQEIITYCKNCKKLTIIYPKISSVCDFCGLSVIDTSKDSIGSSYEPIYHKSN